MHRTDVPAFSNAPARRSEQFFMEWDKQGLQPGPELGKLEESYGVTRP